jgi:hypothetical protein
MLDSATPAVFVTNGGLEPHRGSAFYRYYAELMVWVLGWILAYQCKTHATPGPPAILRSRRNSESELGSSILTVGLEQFACLVVDIRNCPLACLDFLLLPRAAIQVTWQGDGSQWSCHCSGQFPSRSLSAPNWTYKKSVALQQPYRRRVFPLGLYYSIFAEVLELSAMTFLETATARTHVHYPLWHSRARLVTSNYIRFHGDCGAEARDCLKGSIKWKIHFYRVSDAGE